MQLLDPTMFPIILVAATAVFAVLLAERFYLRNILHLNLPKKREGEEKEGLPYDLVTIQEVNPPYLKIEWTEFKFISFRNAIRLVFILFTFAVMLIALKIIIFPDIAVYPWGILETVLTVILIALLVVPIFIWYFFLEVWLNTDTVLEKIIMLVLSFGATILILGIFILSIGSNTELIHLVEIVTGHETTFGIDRQLLQLILIVVTAILFVPLVYIANLLIGINFGAILANDWSVFRYGWDYLQFKNKTWFDRVSALAGLAIVAPAPLFAVHSILSVLTGTISEGGIIVPFLLSQFQIQQGTAIEALIRLFGFWTIFDTVFLQLAVVLKFLKQTCFIAIVGGTSPDAPEGVAPQAVFLTLSYVVYLLFTAVGSLIATPILATAMFDPVTQMGPLGNIFLRALADASPILLLVGNVIFLAHILFLDWNIYPTESGIIFIADSEISGLDTFVVYKYIHRALGSIKDTVKFRGQGSDPLNLRDYLWGMIDLGIGVAVFGISLLLFADEFSKLAGVMVGFVIAIGSTFLMPKN